MNNMLIVAEGLMKELKVTNDLLQQSEKYYAELNSDYGKLDDELDALRDHLCMTVRGGELLIKFDKEYEEKGE